MGKWSTRKTEPLPDLVNKELFWYHGAQATLDFPLLLDTSSPRLASLHLVSGGYLVFSSYAALAKLSAGYVILETGTSLTSGVPLRARRRYCSPGGRAPTSWTETTARTERSSSPWWPAEVSRFTAGTNSAGQNSVKRFTLQLLVITQYSHPEGHAWLKTSQGRIGFVVVSVGGGISPLKSDAEDRTVIWKVEQSFGS